jgi:hypothetical protein
MTGWTAEELSVIDRTDELDLQSERADGSTGDRRAARRGDPGLSADRGHSRRRQERDEKSSRA